MVTVDGPFVPRAIPTMYAGCQFRSRLEARWAVFLDALQVPWDYERETYRIPAGKDTRTTHYLPDFYLPTLGTWVEVKGDVAELVKCAPRYHQAVRHAALPGLEHSTGTTRGLLVLGPIPRPDGHTPCHWLYQHGDPDHVTRSLATFTDTGTLTVDHRPVHANDDTPLALGHWLNGTRRPITERDLCPERGLAQSKPWPGPVWIAYSAARRARFEYGETPDSTGTAKVGRRTVGPAGLSDKTERPAKTKNTRPVRTSA